MAFNRSEPFSVTLKKKRYSVLKEKKYIYPSVTIDSSIFREIRFSEAAICGPRLTTPSGIVHQDRRTPDRSWLVKKNQFRRNGRAETRARQVRRKRKRERKSAPFFIPVVTAPSCRNASQILEVCQRSRPRSRTNTRRHRKPNPIVPAVARGAHDSPRGDDGGDDGGGRDGGLVSEG